MYSRRAVAVGVDVVESAVAADLGGLEYLV
jgi:hypothetical protein